ncbi:MAG: elongation factor P, partial [Clostridia bacterium]|nr:elongation factor P [Clostridia bacterium]
MITAGEFRKGITVEIDGQVWSISDFLHVKPGKGAAFV